MELGDKTQFSTLALAARTGSPVLIFFGALLAYALLMGIAVIIGSRLPKVVPLGYIKIFSGAVFIFFGVLFLLSVAGISVL
ncbi:MAG: TMEM165/GDT1 family protein [Candidatus Hadarchaeota archaeon]